MSERAATKPPHWAKRVAWMLALWAGSVGALAVLAYLLRVLMTWAGMHT